MATADDFETTVCGRDAVADDNGDVCERRGVVFITLRHADIVIFVIIIIRNNTLSRAVTFAIITRSNEQLARCDLRLSCTNEVERARQYNNRGTPRCVR